MSARPRRFALTTYWMLVPALVVPAASAGEPDWEGVARETLGHLQELVRINTVNPPGNELEAAQYLRKVLEREGISSEIIETAPGRGALLARLPATVSDPAEPLLLMGHLDVVGVDRAQWTFDPFAAEVHEGAVWGRGTLDDKGMLAAELMTLLLLKRRQVPLRREVVFLAEPDEEAGGHYGMDALVENHFQEIRAGYALNEGGRILEEDGRVLFVGIQNSEKRSHYVELIAHGKSGHGSLPHPENPVARLAAAVAKIAGHRFPARLTPSTERFFRSLAEVSEPEAARWMRRLEDPRQLQQAADKLSEMSVHWNALLRNTVAPTIIEGGFKGNVIPDEARATLNLRLLPGQSLPEAVEQLKQLVDDPAIELAYQEPGPEPPAAPMEGEFFRAMARVARQMFPEAVVTPYMHQAATDSGPLRAHGVETYGLLIFPITGEELLLLHSSNEHLRLESLRRGTEFLYRAVRDFAGR